MKEPEIVSLGELPGGHRHGDANPNEKVGLHCVSTEDHQRRTEDPLISRNPEPYHGESPGAIHHTKNNMHLAGVLVR